MSGHAEGHPRRPRLTRGVLAGAVATIVLAAVAALALAGVVLQRDTAAEGREGGTLRLLSSGHVDTLDPAVSQDAVAISVLRAVLRTPYAYAPDRPQGVVADLAAGEPEITDGGRRLEVRIRSGVAYAPPLSGEVTAHDVAYALQRSLLPSVGSPYGRRYLSSVVGAPDVLAGRASRAAGIEAPDDRTLVVRATQPAARLIARTLTLPYAAPVPPGLGRRHDTGRRSTYAAHLAQTGPYRFAGAIAPDADRLVLERFQPLDRQDPRPAFADRIEVLQNGGPPDEVVGRVLTGRGTLSADAVPADQLARVLRDRRAQVVLPLSGGMLYVTLNTRVAPFGDVHARRAVTAALDQAAARDALGGPVIGDIPTHWLPPGTPGFEEAGGQAGPGDPILSAPQGDLALARRELRRSRAPAPRGPLEVLTIDDPDLRRLAGIVTRTLRTLGWPARTNPVEADVFYGRCATPARTPAVCAALGWSRDVLDPESFLRPLVDGTLITPRDNLNAALLDDPALNARLAEAAAEVGAQDRADAWGDVDRQVTALAPGIPLVWDRFPLLHATDVEGVVDAQLAQWDLTATSLR